MHSMPVLAGVATDFGWLAEAFAGLKLSVVASYSGLQANKV